MKHRLLIFFTLFLLPASLLRGQAADTLVVGFRTVNLGLDSDGMLQALSEGRDLNFDGVVDEAAGEVPGSLTRIDPQNHQILARRTLPGFIRNLALAGDRGYFVQNDPVRISSYDTRTLETRRDTLVLEDATSGILFYGISVEPESGELFVGTGGFAGAGEIQVFTPDGQLLHRAATGFGSSEALFQDNPETASTAAYIINEGTFGGDNATLSYLNIQRQLFQSKSGRPLGDTGNGMAVDAQGRLYIALNGSHSIEVFDTRSMQSVGTVATATSGFDGPRQVLILPDQATGVISTFANDLRFFDLATLQITDTLTVGQKPEHMVVKGGFLYVANGGFTGFAEDSTIFVIDWQRRAIVDTLVVGIRTTELAAIPAVSRFFALSEGLDLNFDGILQPEAGEVPGKLAIIDAVSQQVIAERTLDSFARNLALVTRQLGDILILQAVCVQAEPSRISVFNSEDLRTVTDTLLLEDPAQGLSFYKLQGGLDELAISTGGFAGDGGELLIFDLPTERIMHRFHTGFGASQVLELPNANVPGVRDWYVLNEGVFGVGNASLSLVQFGADIFEAIAGKRLGDTANGGALHDGRLYIVVNGSHRVEVLDVNDYRYAGSVDVGTSGFDGPRQVAFLPGEGGLVTTFSNDLRTFDLQSLQVTKVTPTGNKPEDVLVAGTQVFVANGGFTGFMEDSTILVFDAATVPVRQPGLAGQIPAAFSLEQNYPNPFYSRAGAGRRAGTHIAFALPQPARVQVSIYNLLGQEIARLLDAPFAAGQHSLFWEGRDAAGRSVAAGTYFLRVQAGSQVQVRMLSVLRN